MTGPVLNVSDFDISTSGSMQDDDFAAPAEHRRSLQAVIPPPPPPLPPGIKKAEPWGDVHTAVFLITLALVGGFMILWIILMAKFRRKLLQGERVSKWEMKFLFGRQKHTVPHVMSLRSNALNRSASLQAPVRV